MNATSCELALRKTAATGAAVSLALLVSTAALAQSEPKPGFNLFSVEQDIEIGRQSAAEAERELPILKDAPLEHYVNAVTRSVAAAAPGARYPYQVRVVNVSEINAFTFPGGFLYVNRGLIEATRSESELAGVLAHEVAHVALRHGTHQASKAYAAQAGLGILGGLLGRDGSRSSRILEAIGGVGLNAVFLKFSRSDELEADLVGVRMLHQAGYDPKSMVDFFELLGRQREADPGKVEQFFSSHPAPGDRAARLRAEASRLGPVERPRQVGGFAQVQSELKDRPAATRRAGRLRAPEERPGRGGADPTTIRVEPPSPRVRTFQQRNGLFQIDHPANWRSHEAQRGYGVVIAPARGILETADGRQNVVYGAIINHYDPFDRGGGGSPEEAADDLIDQILRGSPHLRVQSGSERRVNLDGASGRSVVLSGRSPMTATEEQVTVFTRELTDDHMLYVLFVTPVRDFARLEPTFDRMVESLRVNDRAVHR